VPLSALIQVDYRWAAGDADRLGGLTSELLGMRPDLIVTEGTPALAAARKRSSGEADKGQRGGETFSRAVWPLGWYWLLVLPDLRIGSVCPARLTTTSITLDRESLER
jgi:hypothetical protein